MIVSTDLPPGPRIKAIPTRYKNIEFRSKLEANVASCLDACRVPWTYEQEGYDLAGEWYLPDFWLPQARQFVEVKGQIADPSVEKCIRLAYAIRADLVPDEDEAARPAAVVVLASPFVRRFDGFANEVFGFGFNGVEQVDALLVECPHCSVRFFMTTDQGWTCSACCGWSDSHARLLVNVEHRRGVTTYRQAR